MEHDQELALALLKRSIEHHEQQLASAEAVNNTRLASRIQRDLDRLLEQREKMTGTPVARHSVPPKPSRAKGSRPELVDESTVVDPHGARWMELMAYVQKLNEHFPKEYLTDRCGFFSTEREFTRYILELERRVSDER